jgi:Icc-related predicted phosphoesterase
LGKGILGRDTKSIRILVVSDIHGSEIGIQDIVKKSQALKPDLVVICGDITHFGPPGQATKFLDMIEVPTFAVPGNCDPPEVIPAIEDSKAKGLHRRAQEFRGFTFVGLGGAPQSPNGLEMEFSEERIFEFLDEVMVPKGILVTHCPAWGRNDTARGAHLGSKAIADIVEKYKPKLALSGHIHDARGILEDKDTIFVNPGPAKHGFGALVVINGDKVKAELLDGFQKS